MAPSSLLSRGLSMSLWDSFRSARQSGIFRVARETRWPKLYKKVDRVAVTIL